MSISLVTAKANIYAICAEMAAARAPQLPLVQATAEGRIGLVVLNSPEIRWPAATIAGYGSRPLCVLIGGDTGYGTDDPPPDAWSCARRLRYWNPNAAIIHAAAGEAEHYRMAAALTLAVGRVALIETTSRRAEEWGAFLRCPRTIGILPRGGVHPTAPGTVH